MGHDDIDLEIDQFGKQRRQPVIVAICPAVFDDQIKSLVIAEIAQAGAERLGPLGQTVGGWQSQKSNTRDFRRRRLRSAGARPAADYNRATEKPGNKFPPSHV